MVKLQHNLTVAYVTPKMYITLHQEIKVRMFQIRDIFNVNAMLLTR